MSKSVAMLVVCLMPLTAACPSQGSCSKIGSNVVIEVATTSQAENAGDCKVPPAFLLGALGCNVALSYSADLCVVDYNLLCVGGVEIELNVTQAQDDGIVGTLHKTDPRSDCSLDLDISIKPAPASAAEAATSAS